MEVKKSPKANVENKRFLFITIGIVFSLSMILVFLELTRGLPPKVQVSQDVAKVEDDVVVSTQQQQATPPPPPPPPPASVMEQFELAPEEDVDESLDLNDSEVSATDTTSTFVIDTDQGEQGPSDPDEIFVIVEKMPEFPGGNDKIMPWISKNLKYPQAAVENGVQGRVIVQFVIGADGNVTDVKVGRGVDRSLDAEAIRVIKSMPAWRPGEQRKKKVRVSYSVPINFKLN